MDTSSKICSVAILEDSDLIIEKYIDDDKTHSQKLMPLIDDVLKTCKMSLQDFDLLACCTGPGSFTGVRIGVSTVKAFYDVCSIPIASISSLESLAYNTLSSNYRNKTDLVCSVIDAKNNNVYYGLFKRNGENFELLESLNAKNISEMMELLHNYKNLPILFVGDGSRTHEYTLLQFFSKAIFVERKYDIQTSASIGKSAFYHYNKGEAR